MLAPAAAQASVIVPLTEPELVAKADVIVFGTLVRTQTVRNDVGFVVTRAELQVYRALRGAKNGEFLLIEVPGGQLPSGEVAEVSGSPKLVVGQPLVAFLQARGQVLRPLGMSFGVLHVRGKGAEQRVYRSLDGLQLLLPSGRSASASKYQIDGVPLAALMTRIEAELRNQGIRRQAPHGQD